MCPIFSYEDDMIQHSKILLIILVIVASVSLVSDATSGEVEDVQRAIERAGADWVAGETSVSSLEPAEFRKMLGFNMPDWLLEEAKSWAIGFDRLPDSLVPDYLDWRDYNGGNYITPITNQLNCGSCVAFGTVASLEAAVKIAANQPGLLIDLSEQHLFSCGPWSSCQTGWTTNFALDYMRSSGVPDESCNPYKAVDNNCHESCANWQSRAIRIQSWSWVCTLWEDNEAICNAVAQGPVPTSLDIYRDFVTYRGGIYEHVSGAYEGGHAVCIVGYDKINRYWICKNSWGKGWGENGFFRIRWGQVSVGTFTAKLNFNGPIPTSQPSHTPTFTPTRTPTPTNTSPMGITPTVTPTPGGATKTPTSTNTPSGATHTPTSTPTYKTNIYNPHVRLGGYMDSRVSSTAGGKITILAMAGDNDGDPVKGIVLGDIPLTCIDPSEGIFQFGPISLTSGVASGRYLLQLIPFDYRGNRGAPWPFLDVTHY